MFNEILFFYFVSSILEIALLIKMIGKTIKAVYPKRLNIVLFNLNSGFVSYVASINIIKNYNFNILEKI